MLTIITIAVFHMKKSSRAWIAVFSRRVCPSIVTQVHDVVMAMMRMMTMIANDNNGNHTGNELDDNHDDRTVNNPNHGKIVSLRQGHCS